MADSRRTVLDAAAIRELVAVFVAIFVLFATLSYTAWLPGAAATGGHAGAVGIAIAVGVIFGIAGVGTLLRVWARSGGRPRVVELDRALETGSVADDAVAIEWVPDLERWQQSLRVALWVAPALAILFVLTAIPRLVAASSVALSIVVVVIAVLGIAAATAVVARAQRRLPRVPAVLADLERRQAAVDARVASEPSDAAPSPVESPEDDGAEPDETAIGRPERGGPAR